VGHAQHRKEGQGPTVNEPEYLYPGQWFDDMGALALTFADSPRVGIDIARSGVDRAQANDMALKLMRAGITPYEEAAPPLGMEIPDAEFVEPA
jgi:hypothetical protein